MEAIEIVRACVRPFIAIATVVVILVLGVMLIAKHGDAEMAKLIMTFLLATGAVVTGFYFGERARRQ